MTPWTLDRLYTEAGLDVVPPFAQYVTLKHPPYKKQIEAVTLSYNDNWYGIYDEAGCVDADTEFLAPTGWIRIADWAGEKVAQFDKETQQVDWGVPLEFIKKPCKVMLHFKPRQGMDMMLSPEHRVLRYSVTNLARDGKLGAASVCTAAELASSAGVNEGKGIPTTFSINRPGVALTDAQLRVMVAVIADGHFPAKKTKRCAVRLKKSRKKERLTALLEDAGIAFTCAPCLPEGFHIFKFEAPLKDKEFTAFYWDCSQSQLELIVQELPHWDGSIDARGSGPFSFSTTSKLSADFASYAGSACGVRTTLRAYDRRDELHKRIEYGVTFCKRNTFVGVGAASNVSEVPAPDGFKYCFSVPKTFLVLRRNGHVFVTGNTGKTNVAQALAIYHIYAGNRVVCATTPTLAYQFEEQFYEEFLGIEKFIRIEIVDYGPAERSKRFAQFQASGVWPFLVMSHELFYRVSEELKGYGFNVLIIDEAQKVKNVASKTFLRVEAFRGQDRNESVLLTMTGTPLHTEAIDAYAQIRLTNPAAYESFSQFESDHVVEKRIRLPAPIKRKGGGVVKFRTIRIGYRRLDKIHAALFAHGRRVLKKEVYEINDPIITRVPVVLSPEHMELYQKLGRERILEMGDDAIISAISDQELRVKIAQIISCPELFVPEGTVLENRIHDTCADLVDGTDMRAAKVIVFCHFKQAVKHYLKLFASHNPAVLFGEITGKKRQVQLDKFKNDPACRMLVANWKSGGAGFNFQEQCSTIIFIEAIGVPGDFIQAMNRINRAGQKYTPNIYLLSARNTVAPRLIDKMLNREAVNQEVYLDKSTMFDYYRIAS